MSATIKSATIPGRHPSPESETVRSRRAPRAGPPDAAASRPASNGRGGVTLFRIPFATAMDDPDIALLARTLDLTTHMYPKMRPSPNSPSVARLDHFSGLFLERGRADGYWVLEARTWGHPAAKSIHEWQLIAAGAARLLDPAVAFPQRLAAVPPEYPTRPPGRAANKRLARIGRRILGLE